eukprot:TRINITY_DN92850_c0_g1_i1.p1 TRINITY_DN92850_c0_g1~~TRINITY_DN92850_c0_g1_i1.p1  ORF type:complete len:438 (+),score=153.83 TRINITY_DN92850_c0_g1_i1:62-1375(+)
MGVQRLNSTAQATAKGLRIFVAGIPWHITEEILKKDFEECGVVEDLCILKGPDGYSKGRAFITFQEKAAVEAALKYDNTEYGGRTLYVKLAEEKRKGKDEKPSEAAGPKKERPQKAPASGEKPEGCVSLCLKRINEADETEIRKFLKGCSIQSVRIVIDRVTGNSRGIAFVDFTSSEEVDKAMAFNGKSLGGGSVEMFYEAPKARPRPDGCLSVAVKKLVPEATEKDIRRLFKGLESISDVRVILDRWTQQCNGLAFVEFTEVADVEAAVRRDGMSVKGKTVFICYETKKKREEQQNSGKKRKTAKVDAAEEAEEAKETSEKTHADDSRPTKKRKKEKLKNEEETKEETEDVSAAAAASKEAKKARKREARKDRRQRKQAAKGENDAVEVEEGDEDVKTEANDAEEAEQQGDDAPAKAGKKLRKKKTRKALRAAEAA